MVIVELKRAGVRVSTDEKAQCWKYVKELSENGLLLSTSRVTCFVLGSEIDPAENHEREEKSGLVKIRPIHYHTVLERAKSRLLKLFDRVSDVPFLNQEEITEYLDSGNLYSAEQTSLDL